MSKCIMGNVAYGPLTVLIETFHVAEGINTSMWLYSRFLPSRTLLSQSSATLTIATHNTNRHRRVRFSTLVWDSLCRNSCIMLTEDNTSGVYE